MLCGAGYHVLENNIVVSWRRTPTKESSAKVYPIRSKFINFVEYLLTSYWTSLFYSEFTAVGVLGEGGGGGEDEILIIYQIKWYSYKSQCTRRKWKSSCYKVIFKSSHYVYCKNSVPKNNIYLCKTTRGNKSCTVTEKIQIIKCKKLFYINLTSKLYFKNIYQSNDFP